MKLNSIAAAVVGLLAWWQTASAVDVSWNRMPGSGLHIAGNEAGGTWAIGVERLSESGFGIYSFTNGNWNGQAGAGRRITVDPSGRAWMVDDQNKIYRYNAGTWQMLPGLGTDIAAGGDGSIWILGVIKGAGGFGIFKWESTTQNWSSISGAGVRLAVEKSGSPWLVNENGDIFRYDLGLRSWSQKPGKARSVHTGLGTGAVWVMGAEPMVNGYPVSRYVPASQTWEPYGSYGAVGITEVNSTPWIIQSDGAIFSKGPDLIIGSITVTNPPVTGALTPQPLGPANLSAPGKLLCSQLGLTVCGDTKADYVEKFTLDTTCDSGFYDMIWGGTCWKCPDDTDSSGSWIRSATAVDKDDACFRIRSKETFSKATKVKSPAWPWDCSSGSFWDLYSPDGIGGSCWTCPADYPRRTGYHITWNDACASPLTEEKPATLLTFNGCPTPNAAEMDLPGKRTPGKPFLDIGAGSFVGDSSGACYACPIADEAGNFLITERNAKPIYDKAGNTGCTVKLKWQPPPFYEPGLTYMQGVKEVIWDQKLFDGDRITGFLYDLAEAEKLGDATPEAKAWVMARWQEIAKNPYNNEQFRTIMFTLLKAALKRNAIDRTPGEQKLIQSFSNYIRQRRTYLAEQGLQMYDTWKVYDDAYRRDTSQTKSISQLFYYGTVPLDFQGTLGGLVAMGGSATAAISGMVQFNAFAQAAQGSRSKSLFAITDKLKLLKSAQGFKIISGASLIQVAFAILTSIAIDQFVDIQSARPKLEASLAMAKEPIDLNTLAQSDNGQDMLYVFWAKAMDTTDKEDPQVVQLAAYAQAVAHQSGYQAPPKELRTGAVEASVGDRIVSGNSGVTAGNLMENQKLVSRNGKYEARMQVDGNFVIYAENGQPIWATGTNGRGSGAYRLAMQADSNLVVYGSTGATWASGVRSGTAPYTLIMQDDANLVIYDSANRAIWASNTQR
jgi:hypothetical protein